MRFDRFNTHLDQLGCGALGMFIHSNTFAGICAYREQRKFYPPVSLESRRSREKMIIGDTSKFAIESGITKAYERPSFLALGYFCFHVGGLRCGVHEPDATLMALPLDTVKERIEARGTHVALFSSEPNAEHILGYEPTSQPMALAVPIHLES